MKKIFLAAAVILLVTSVTLANKADRKARREARHEKKEVKKEMRTDRRYENKNEVSYRTRQQFSQDFPNAKNVTFEKDPKFDKVVFTSDMKKLSAYYDYESHLIGTTQKKRFSALPETAQKEIQKQYKDYTVEAVILYDDNEDNDTDMILFGTPFEDADNYFVSLKKDNKEIVVEVSMPGVVSYFTEIK